MTKKLTQDRREFVCELLLAKKQSRFPPWVASSHIAALVGLPLSMINRIESSTRPIRWHRLARCKCGGKAILCCHACNRSDWQHARESRAMQLINAKAAGILPTKIGRKAIAKLCKLPISEIRRIAPDPICQNGDKKPCPRCGCPTHTTACRACWIGYQSFAA